MKTRLDRRFAELRAANRAGLVTFVTAGDPNYEVSREILFNLPEAGADIIELGMPFSDPMADGPAIQASSLRALRNGQNMRKTLALVAEFRKLDPRTPLVLMGYYNPIYAYGVAAFLKDAVKAGIDGLIVVDLPPEEDDELCLPAIKAGLNFIRLATPTTDDRRLPTVLANTSGFLYYVAIAGITGTKSASIDDVSAAIGRLRRATDLPIAVGFGIRNAEQAAAIARIADAAVVGSAIVDRIAAAVDAAGRPHLHAAEQTLALVREIAAGMRQARSTTPIATGRPS